MNLLKENRWRCPDQAGSAVLEKKSRDEHAHIVLIDESGFLLNPLVRRTWAMRGHTPRLMSFGRHRDKVSTIKAIAVTPRGRRIRPFWRTNAKHYIDVAGMVAFLSTVLGQVRGPVIVVWDGGKNHKGPLIRELLARHKRLHLERLPAYVPDPNPVEMIWSYLKHGLMGNLVPRDVHEVDRVVQEHLLRLGKDPRLIRALGAGSRPPRSARIWHPDDQ